MLRRTVWPLLRWVCVGFTLLFLIVSFSPLTEWWARALAGSWEDPRGDVLIVLGGARIDDQLMGISTYWRCVYAARALATDSGFRTIVLSGGGPGRSLADLMKEFLVCRGTAADRIVTEEHSSSTRENALFTAELLKAQPAGTRVLMTSDYHIWRARRAFAKAGVNVLPRPIPDALKRSTGWPGRWPVFLDLCEETVKQVYYFAHGWI